MSKYKILLSFAFCIFIGLNASAHSTAGYFVTNGSNCYFVMTNWHPTAGEQTSAISANDGVYLDFNLDGLYDGTIDPAIGPFPRGNGGEYYPFSEFVDLTDLVASPTSYATWESEINSWFATNVGTGYTASLVWDPVTDPGCSNATSYYALISPIGTCPTVAGNYFATVADGTVTSEPCGMAPGATDGTFDLDLSGVIVVPPTGTIPTMGEWGLMCLGLMFLILGVISVKQRTEVLEF